MKVVLRLVLPFTALIGVAAGDPCAAVCALALLFLSEFAT